MYLGKDALKFFSVFTSMICHSLLLRSRTPQDCLNSFDELFSLVPSTFAGWCISQGSELANFSIRLQLHQSNCNIARNMSHGTLSCRNILLSSKSGIKLSFSNWVYLALFKLLLILTNFLEPLLYIDLRPGQTCHSKVMHRKEVTHSDGSYEKKSRRRAWLKKWDKVKSHSTLIDWCTGREWPVNCMTVISAWWRSNIPFQRLSGQLNYYITRSSLLLRQYVFCMYMCCIYMHMSIQHHHFFMYPQNIRLTDNLFCFHCVI